ncbi:hypothetical protein [Streptomyces catenulae]|uniref:XRE family transcriptional regulator n=1 Tax=Streptomyces catenulae TaxID=66875 RepID=A0ABV2YXP7_9ACTN|nr:hypothetical protein [Streptomyces catenulae]
MSEADTPFADMVRAALAAPGATYRKLTERAIDPETGYQPSHTTLRKIALDEPVKISPPLVRSIAAAVDKPVREVQIAAAHQYVGLIADDPLGASTPEATVVVAHVPGMTAGDMPKVQELLNKWAGGEKVEANQPDP